MSTRDEGYTKPGVPDVLKWAPVMRGFPEDMEVLTELGWLRFSALYAAGVSGISGSSAPLFTVEQDWRQEHKPLRENWAATRSPHQEGYTFNTPNEVDFSKWAVAPSFPRVVSLTPDHVVQSRKPSGRLTLVRPQFATRFLYDDHQLVWLKKRGLDVALPRFTDVFVRNKHQHSWGFEVVDDFCNVRFVDGFWKSLVNRFSPAGAFYGFVDMPNLLPHIESGEVRALLSGTDPERVKGDGRQAKRVRVNDVYPYAKVRDSASGRYVVNPVERRAVECFNLVLPRGSSHTLIVRRAGTQFTGDKPHTEWVGFPVVVGDGYDKNKLVEDRMHGLYDVKVGA